MDSAAAMRVEPATLSDIPQLSGLLSILFSQEADFQPDAAKQSEGLRRIIGCPETGHILVLRQGDSTIGMVNILYTISTALGARVAILEDMIVDPAKRGAGAGSQLLHAAIEFARAQGCARVTLLTDRDNDQAIRFYRRHGFVASAMMPMRLVFPV